MRSSVYDSNSQWTLDSRPAPAGGTDARATIMACLILAGVAGLMLAGMTALVGALGFGIWELWN